MKVRFTEPFQDQYRKLAGPFKVRFEKQVGFLLKDLWHP